jgi:hypothetical protein
LVYPVFAVSTALTAYQEALLLLDANSRNKRQKQRMNALLLQWGRRYHL